MSLVLISSQTVNGQISNACANKIASNLDSGLSELGKNILKERQSLAEVFESPAKYNFVKNYTLLSESTAYTPLVEKCEELNFTVCKVSTSVAYTSDTGDTFSSLEDSFPLCFPPECKNNQTSLVRYAPSFCETDDQCSLTETVQCDNREVDPSVSDETCEEAARPLQRTSYRRPFLNLVRILDQRCLLNMEGDIGRQTERKNRCRLVGESGDELSRFNLHKDFSVFPDSNGDIPALNDACESLNHTLCYMDSQIMIGEKLIHETKKPICFPSSCTEDTFAATQDTTCTECEVSRSISCPKDNMVGAGTCSADVETAYEVNGELYARHQNIMNSVDSRCIEALHGESSPTCSFQTKSSKTQDLKVGEKTTEDNFTQTCYSLGGQLCLVDADVSVDKQEKGENSETIVSFTSYPVCKPTGCSESDNFVAVALNVSASTLVVKDITCFDSPPSSTPTNSPTAFTSPTSSHKKTTSPTVSPTTSTADDPNEKNQAATSGAVLNGAGICLFLCFLSGVWSAI